jgi:hypothetical protein
MYALSLVPASLFSLIIDCEAEILLSIEHPQGLIVRFDRYSATSKPSHIMLTHSLGTHRSESVGVRGEITSLLAGDSFFSSKISSAREQDSPRFDFLSFLEAVQVNKVDVLATTWQQALDTLGTGATAEVRQSLVNLQTSFAFKRPMFRHASLDTDTLFEWLIREVTILRHPIARKHKNLLGLEGVCWDYHTSNESLRPVLIFQRAQHGDLLQYALKKGFQTMTVSHRMDLATDAMSALNALHEAGKRVHSGKLEIIPLS